MSGALEKNDLARFTRLYVIFIPGRRNAYYMDLCAVPSDKNDFQARFGSTDQEMKSACLSDFTGRDLSSATIKNREKIAISLNFCINSRN